MAQPRSVYLSPLAGRGRRGNARHARSRPDVRRRHLWGKRHLWGRKASMTQTDVYAVALPSVQRRTSRVGIQAHAGVLPGVSLLHLNRSPL
jgi:hypothetical protein